MLQANQINFLKALKKIDVVFQSPMSNLHSVNVHTNHDTRKFNPTR